MRKLLPLLFTAFPLGAQAQSAPAWTWARMLNSSATSNATSLATDAAGNTYVAGSFTQPITLAPGTVLTSAGGQDGFVAKYDAAGALLWSRQLAGTANELFQQVATDAAGGVTVVGTASDGSTFGTVTFTNGGFGNSLVLAHLNSQGQVLNVDEIGSGTPFALASDLALDAAGNAYVSGTFGLEATFGSFNLTTPFVGTSFTFDQFLVKVSPQGIPLWAQQGGRTLAPAGAQSQLYYSSLAVEPTGTAYLTWTCNPDAGDFGSVPMPTGFGGFDAVVVKYDPQGTPLWIQRAGSAGEDFAGRTTLDASGRVVVPGFVTGTGTFGGQSVPATSTTTGFLWVVEPAAGATAWVRGIGAAQGAAFRGATADAAGNIYVAGHYSGQGTVGTTTLTGAGGLDGLVASYSATGALRWTQQTAGTGDEAPFFISLDGTNRLAVGGVVGGAGLFGTQAVASQNASPGNFFVAHLGSVLTATKAARAALPLALYPNPAATTEAVVLPVLPAGTQLTITDVLGRVTRRPATATLALANLASGVYVVAASAPDGQHWTTRLVVK
ncbi:T9SS type A sorting domain-containing protein [Hymenobacter sp.]|uniref:T9SS type A sorting domain-containing protein n=1 Tax=Hymenobacter sp. TaxID=1898978 RepID=UPI00286D6127|nr:T9SS type A sorting domain-containing protein [Hymenobacter sp.]